ncbi:MAG TPA: hypothetical protein VMV93_06855 [Chloroflexota bacterium]|nr:hypothetical protein [Chloroflexota bacterium]
MAANISNIQLTVLQLPQVAHDQVPAMTAAELAGAQAQQLLQHEDERASEVVQQMQSAQGNQVGDATSGGGKGMYQGQGNGRRGARQQKKSGPPHPLGVGSLIDIEV